MVQELQIGGTRGCWNHDLRDANAEPALVSSLVSLAPAGAGAGHCPAGCAAAALSARSALSLRQSGFDPDALALGDRRAGGARQCSAGPDRPDPAADGHLLGGCALLLPLRHRLGG